MSHTPLAAQERKARFPRGHIEPEPTVAGRTRGDEHALWVACARCNVVVLAVNPGDGGR